MLMYWLNRHYPQPFPYLDSVQVTFEKTPTDTFRYTAKHFSVPEATSVLISNGFLAAPCLIEYAQLKIAYNL